MGPVSGKIGNLVYYISRGRNFVRRAPGKSRKRPTLKQKIQRVKFGEVMRFISPIAKLINESYNSVKHRQMGTNILVKEILRDGLIGKYPNFFIDYNAVRLLRGRLSWPNGNLQYEEGSREFNLSWQALGHPEHLEDELIVLVHYSLSGNWSIAEGLAQRAQAGCSIHFESPVGNEVIQVWIAFRSPDRRVFSDSQYLGQIIYEEQTYEN